MTNALKHFTPRPYAIIEEAPHNMTSTTTSIPHGKLDFLVVNTHLEGLCLLVVHKQAVVPIIGGSIKTESTYADLGSGEHLSSSSMFVIVACNLG